MSTERTEILIHELMELDPSLKTHEADLRSILSEFRDKRPDITPELAFVTSLRARILLSKRNNISPYAHFSFWALRLVPIGAAVFLILILVPGDILHAPTQVRETSVETTTADIAPTSDSGILRIETGDAPGIPPSDMYTMDSMEDVGVNSKMSMKALPSELLPFTISPQKPGMSITIDSVTIEKAGFIVIYTYLTDGRESVVGISPLLFPGTTTGVPVYLRAQAHAGEYYTATLHIDNGNRVFTRGEDMPFIDRYGNPASAGIEIIPK